MLRTTIAALAFAAVVAAGGAAFAQDVSSGSTAPNASSTTSDGLHTDGTGGRAYPGGQKTN